MYQLAPQVRNYPWGSRSVLAELTGRPSPSTEPEAELWVGSHALAPAALVGSSLTTSLTLEQLIGAHPQRMLGAASVNRFGSRLPYLLKVLAVEGALSIQCHPSTDQVRTAPAGTYPDSWGKPEGVLALTRFEVFAGLQSFRRIRALFASLSIPLLTRITHQLSGELDPVRVLLERLLHLPPQAVHHLTADVLAACRRDDGAKPAAAILRASTRHPHDIGLVVLLMMRHQVLAPGTFMYLPPNVLHAYLYGTAVEIQANSDNVVRAALTSKRIDIPELLRIVDSARQPHVQGSTGCGRMRSWRVPREAHFALHEIGGGDGEAILPGQGTPRVALTLSGATRLSAAGRTLHLQPGQCAFLPATESAVKVSGPGAVYLAGTGDTCSGSRDAYTAAVGRLVTGASS